jgi:hypothetical protein
MTAHNIGTGQERRAAAALGAADWVHLAAAPTFAIMAFLTGVVGDGPHDMVCTAAQHASPLNGMVWMYVLMAAFHSAPWLKLISGRRSAAADPDPVPAGSGDVEASSPALIGIPPHLSLPPSDAGSLSCSRR